MYNTVNVLRILCVAIQYLQYFILQYFNLTWDSPLKLDLATSSMKIVQNTGLGICSFAFSLFALLFKIAQFKEQLWAICLLSTLFKKERLWANRSLKRVAVSELLSSLFTKERWWANHSRFLFKSATSVILSSFRVIRSKKTYLFACFWKFFTAFPRANQSFALSLTKKQMIRSKKVFNINIFLFTLVFLRVPYTVPGIFTLCTIFCRMPGFEPELLHISLQWATHIPIAFLYYTYFSA